MIWYAFVHFTKQKKNKVNMISVATDKSQSPMEKIANAPIAYTIKFIVNLRPRNANI